MVQRRVTHTSEALASRSMRHWTRAASQTSRKGATGRTNCPSAAHLIGGLNERHERSVCVSRGTVLRSHQGPQLLGLFAVEI